MRKPKEGPANNRVNLRLTDDELNHVLAKKGKKTKAKYIRDLALPDYKKAYLLIDENETPVAVFRLKRNAKEAAKVYSNHSVVKAIYE